MKKLLFAVLLFISTEAFCQMHLNIGVDRINLYRTIQLIGDTLFVPPGTAKIIKIGDKVYEIKTTLEEIKQNDFLTGQDGIFKMPPVQYYNGSTLTLPNGK